MAKQSGQIFVLAIGLLICLPLSAHKLKVFATAEGDRILGQAYFVGGAKASGAAIRITNAEGRELARLEPDEAGNFSYRVKRRMNYRVVADSLDGHMATWILAADEFSPKLPGAQEDGAPATVASVSERSAQPAPERVQETTQARSVDLLEQAVARQMRPLREALQAHEEQVRLRDIVGGIGYIIGLAGLGLWWSSRRQSRNR